MYGETTLAHVLYVLHVFTNFCDQYHDVFETHRVS